jgi:hypothetical protein
VAEVGGGGLQGLQIDQDFFDCLDVINKVEVANSSQLQRGEEAGIREASREGRSGVEHFESHLEECEEREDVIRPLKKGQPHT